MEYSKLSSLIMVMITMKVIVMVIIVHAHSAGTRKFLYSENFYATHNHVVFINVTILDVLNTRRKIRGNAVLNL